MTRLRLKATYFKDYDSNSAWVSRLRGTPCWQFLCEEGTSFENWLQPVFEEDVFQREVTLVERLNGVPVQGGSGGLGCTSTGYTYGQPLNSSVLGLGVSFGASVLHESQLKGLGCPIFVDVATELSSKTLSSWEDWVSTTLTPMSPFYYVFNVDCLSYFDYLAFEGFLLDRGYENVRLVGSHVLKLDGRGLSGLFPKEVVRKYSLDWLYGVFEPHSVSQVYLVSGKSMKEAPVEGLDYKTPVSGVVNKPKKVRKSDALLPTRSEGSKCKRKKQVEHSFKGYVPKHKPFTKADKQLHRAGFKTL